MELGDNHIAAAEHPLGPFPFDANNPPVELKVHGRLDPEWRVEENSAGPIPSSPVVSSSPLQTLILVPYGAAKLRITAFPYLRKSTAAP